MHFTVWPSVCYLHLACPSRQCFSEFTKLTAKNSLLRIPSHLWELVSQTWCWTFYPIPSITTQNSSTWPGWPHNSSISPWQYHILQKRRSCQSFNALCSSLDSFLWDPFCISCVFWKSLQKTPHLRISQLLSSYCCEDSSHLCNTIIWYNKKMEKLFSNCR